MSENDSQIHYVLNCSHPLETLSYLSVGFVSTVIVLGFINFVVISGNLLVITSVFISRKLRTVTNFFIVSLAVADLMLGVAVLPFSITVETLDFWIFGEVWCMGWLAVDVWMCTASILNLCAISLDRYLAVTRPVIYPTLMSRKRAKVLIAVVWILSFIICFPPLVGWSERNTHYEVSNHDTDNLAEWKMWNMNESILIFENRTTRSSPCFLPLCELTSNKGYIIYSAIGSFYFPTCVMLFFYWHIYRTAMQTTRAIQQGFRTMKTGSDKGQSEEHPLTLRIHRGKFSSLEIKTVNVSKPHRGISRGSYRPRRNDKNSLSTSVTFPPISRSGKREKIDKISPSDSNDIDSSKSSPKSSAYSSVNTINISDIAEDVNEEKKTSGTMFLRLGKKNVKTHLRKFHNETKAAKTVAIIVGGFIFCWLPFFTIYLASAFKTDPAPKLVFSFFFWLGYCNSAINPCVYALFSKDFRFAFKKIICQCKYKKQDRKRRFTRQSYLQSATIKESDSSSDTGKPS